MTSRQELTVRLRQGECRAEEAAAWARVLDKLQDLERATRRYRQGEYSPAGG